MTFRALVLAAFASPRSSLMGLAVLAVTGAFLEGRITLTEFLGAFGILTGTGLLASKDAGK